MLNKDYHNAPLIRKTKRQRVSNNANAAVPITTDNQYAQSWQLVTIH